MDSDVDMPEYPEHPIRPQYFTPGMHVLFAVLTPFTCGVAVVPWLILYGTQRRAEERHYAEAMSAYHAELAEFQAALHARHQRP